jgi:hypothetical protein
MQRSLVVGAFLLVLLIAGCSANPAAAPGPAVEQGAAGHERDRDRDRDADKSRQSQDGPCPAGEHLFRSSDNGRTSCVRD